MSDNQRDDADSLQPDDPRREFLKLAGAGVSVAGLAGCGGDGGGATESPTDTDTDAGMGDTDADTDGGSPTETGMSEDEKMGGTFNVALTATWETLFPMKHAVAPTYYQEYNVAPRLATYDLGADEVRPGALQSWEWADDEETTLRCTLKEGMTFHPGPDGQDYGECTAEDLVWTINSITEEGYAGGWIQKFLWPTPPITGAEEVDEYTFDITMEQTYVPIIVGNLTNTFVISKEAVEDLGAEQFARTPVSVGPYRVVSSEFGTSSTLERFEEGLDPTELGYAGPAYADTIEFEVITDPSTRLSSLRNGEINMVPDAEPQNLQTLTGDDSIPVYGTQAWNFDWLYLGGSGGDQPARDALNQKDVRQAVAYAVDRTSIADNAYFGFAEPDDDMLTDAFSRDLADTVDGQDVWNPEMFPLEADPDTAQSLLSEAGYENLTVEITTRTNASEVRGAQVIQQNLVDAGFDASLNQVDATTFSNIEREGNYDILYSSLATLSPDYEQVINYYLPEGDLNSMGYDNPEVTELIRESRVTTDEATRDEIFRELFELMIEDAPWVYLNHTTKSWVFSSGSDFDRGSVTPLSGYLDLTDMYTTE